MKFAGDDEEIAANVRSEYERASKQSAATSWLARVFIAAFLVGLLLAATVAAHLLLKLCEWAWGWS